MAISSLQEIPNLVVNRPFIVIGCIREGVEVSVAGKLDTYFHQIAVLVIGNIGVEAGRNVICQKDFYSWIESTVCLVTYPYCSSPGKVLTGPVTIRESPFFPRC